MITKDKLWHSNTEQPQSGKEILFEWKSDALVGYVHHDIGYWIPRENTINVVGMKWGLEDITRWMYMEDIL